jgi:hypothetical protein
VQLPPPAQHYNSPAAAKHKLLFRQHLEHFLAWILQRDMQAIALIEELTNLKNGGCE